MSTLEKEVSTDFLLVLLFVFKSILIAWSRRDTSFLGLSSILRLVLGVAVSKFLFAGAH